MIFITTTIGGEPKKTNEELTFFRITELKIRKAASGDNEANLYTRIQAIKQILKWLLNSDNF